MWWISNPEIHVPETNKFCWSKLNYYYRYITCINDSILLILWKKIILVYVLLWIKVLCCWNIQFSQLLKMFLVCTNKESLFYEIELININEPISNIVSVVFEVHIQCNSEYNSIQYSVVLIWICNLDDYESCSPVINAPDSPDQKNQTGWRLLVNISKLWSSMKNKEDISVRQ